MLQTLITNKNFINITGDHLNACKKDYTMS